ncbi:MAG TPA: sugar MFS transporter [Edaphocola sp.]|nr:sugar MFS transporter [Edaphocola sp.]
MHDNKNNYGFALLVIGIVFATFGFITWANSQLILFFRLSYNLTVTQSYLVDTAFFAAYFFMSLPSSLVVKKVGYQRSLALGVLCMGIGAALFIPAAYMKSYPVFLTGLFIIGIGLAQAQTAANPYVTILGPEESAAKRISIMGICNKIAGIVAVFLLGAIILKDSGHVEAQIQLMNELERREFLDGFAGRIVNLYVVIAAVFTGLAMILMRLSLPVVSESEDTVANPTGADSSILSHRNLVLGALAIFFYVGAEVISYGVFADFGTSLGFDKETAKIFPTYTGYALILGYFITIATVPKYISQRNALVVGTLSSIALLLIAMNSTGWTAVCCFALLGLSQSVMWPAIWPLALAGLGKHTKLGSAILVMMIVGGAVLPPLMGKLADMLRQSSNLTVAANAQKFGFLIMIPCWLFILFYALNGYKSKYIKGDR